MADFILNGRVATTQITNDIVAAVTSASKQLKAQGLKIPIEKLTVTDAEIAKLRNDLQKKIASTPLKLEFTGGLSKTGVANLGKSLSAVVASENILNVSVNKLAVAISSLTAKMGVVQRTQAQATKLQKAGVQPAVGVGQPQTSRGQRPTVGKTDIASVLAHKKATDKARISAKNFSTSLISVTGSVGKVNSSLSKSNAALSAFGEGIVKSGVRLAAFAVGGRLLFGITDAIKSMVGEIITLNQTMTNLNKIFGLTKSELREFKGEILDLAVNFGVSVDEVVKASQIFVQQGLSTADTLDAVRASILAVNAANISFTDATELITVAVNSFNLEFENAIDVVDRLTTIADSSAATVGDLAQVFRRAGSAAATAGLSFEQLGAIAAVVRETTRLSATTIGAGFKTILVNVVQNEKVLNRYGIEVRKSNGEMLDMFTILKRLSARFRELNKEQQVQLGSTIAGKRRFTELSALLGKFEKAQLLAEIATNSAGNALAKQAKQLDTITSALERTKAELTKAIDTFAEAGAADAIQGIVNLGNTLVKIFGGVIEVFSGIPGLLPTVALVAFAKIVVPKIGAVGKGVRSAGKQFFNLGAASEEAASKIVESLNQEIAKIDKSVEAHRRLIEIKRIVLDLNDQLALEPGQSIFENPFSGDFDERVQGTLPIEGGGFSANNQAEVVEKNNIINNQLKIREVITSKLQLLEQQQSVDLTIQVGKRKALIAQLKNAHLGRAQQSKIFKEQTEKLRNIDREILNIKEKQFNVEAGIAKLRQDQIALDTTHAANLELQNASLGSQNKIVKTLKDNWVLVAFFAASAVGAYAEGRKEAAAATGETDKLGRTLGVIAGSAADASIFFTLFGKSLGAASIPATVLAGLVSGVVRFLGQQEEEEKRLLELEQRRVSVARSLADSHRDIQEIIEKSAKISSEDPQRFLKLLQLAESLAKIQKADLAAGAAIGIIVTPKFADVGAIFNALLRGDTTAISLALEIKTKISEQNLKKFGEKVITLRSFIERALGGDEEALANAFGLRAFDEVDGKLVDLGKTFGVFLNDLEKDQAFPTAESKLARLNEVFQASSQNVDVLLTSVRGLRKELENLTHFTPKDEFTKRVDKTATGLANLLGGPAVPGAGPGTGSRTPDDRGGFTLVRDFLQSNLGTSMEETRREQPLRGRADETFVANLKKVSEGIRESKTKIVTEGGEFVGVVKNVFAEIAAALTIRQVNLRGATGLDNFNKAIDAAAKKVPKLTAIVPDLKEMAQQFIILNESGTNLVQVVGEMSDAFKEIGQTFKGLEIDKDFKKATKDLEVAREGFRNLPAGGKGSQLEIGLLKVRAKFQNKILDIELKRKEVLKKLGIAAEILSNNFDKAAASAESTGEATEAQKTNIKNTLEALKGFSDFNTLDPSTFLGAVQSGNFKRAFGELTEEIVRLQGVKRKLDEADTINIDRTKDLIDELDRLRLLVLELEKQKTIEVKAKITKAKGIEAVEFAEFDRQKKILEEKFEIGLKIREIGNLRKEFEREGRESAEIFAASFAEEIQAAKIDIDLEESLGLLGEGELGAAANLKVKAEQDLLQERLKSLDRIKQAQIKASEARIKLEGVEFIIRAQHENELAQSRLDFELELQKIRFGRQVRDNPTLLPPGAAGAIRGRRLGGPVGDIGGAEVRRFNLPIASGEITDEDVSAGFAEELKSAIVLGEEQSERNAQLLNLAAINFYEQAGLAAAGINVASAQDSADIERESAVATAKIMLSTIRELENSLKPKVGDDLITLVLKGIGSLVFGKDLEAQKGDAKKTLDEKFNALSENLEGEVNPSVTHLGTAAKNAGDKINALVRAAEALIKAQQKEVDRECKEQDTKKKADDKRTADKDKAAEEKAAADKAANKQKHEEQQETQAAQQKTTQFTAEEKAAQDKGETAKKRHEYAQKVKEKKEQEEEKKEQKEDKPDKDAEKSTKLNTAALEDFLSITKSLIPVFQDVGNDIVAGLATGASSGEIAKTLQGTLVSNAPALGEALGEGLESFIPSLAGIAGPAGAAVGTLVGAGLGAIEAKKAKKKAEKEAAEERRKALIKAFEQASNKFVGVFVKLNARIAQQLTFVDDFIKGTTLEERIASLRDTSTRTVAALGRLTGAQDASIRMLNEKADVEIKIAEQLRDEISKLRDAGREAFGTELPDIIKAKMGKALLETFKDSPEGLVGVSFVPELTEAIEAGLKIIEIEDPEGAKQIEKTISAIGLLKLGVVDTIEEGVAKQVDLEDRMANAVDQSNIFLKDILEVERKTLALIRGPGGEVPVNFNADPLAGINLTGQGTAASGSLTSGELQGLLAGVEREKTAMPSGSRLVIANDSELILTKKQAQKIFGQGVFGGRGRSFANGTPGIAAVRGGTSDDLNVNISINSNRVVKLTGLDQVKREITKSLEDRLSATASQEELDVLKDVLLNTVVTELKKRRIIGAI
jgi:TP901 family phage tail tape measure protein